MRLTLILSCVMLGHCCEILAHEAAIDEFLTFRGAKAVLNLSVKSDKTVVVSMTSKAAPLLVRVPLFQPGRLSSARLIVLDSDNRIIARAPLPVTESIESYDVVRIPSGGFISQQIKFATIAATVSTMLKSGGIVRDAHRMSRLFVRCEVATEHFSDTSLLPNYQDGFSDKVWSIATRPEVMTHMSLWSNSITMIVRDGQWVLDSESSPVRIENELAKFLVNVPGDGGPLSLQVRLSSLTDKKSERSFLRIQGEIDNTGSLPVSVFDPFFNSSIRPHPILIEWSDASSSFRDIRMTPTQKVEGAKCVDWYEVPPGETVGRTWFCIPPSRHAETTWKVSVRSSLRSHCPWYTLTQDRRRLSRAAFLDEVATAIPLWFSQPVVVPVSDMEK